MKRKKAQIPSLGTSHGAESSDVDESSSSKISSVRKRRVGNDYCAPIFARDRDIDRKAEQSDARSTPTDSCSPAASNDVVRSMVVSKLPSRVRGVEQPIRGPSGVRNRDPNIGRSGRRFRAAGTPISSRARQLLRRVCMPFLA